jgi:hypothetical protein
MNPDVADRKSASRVSHAEIKAGVFLTFCLALFVAMLFVLGKFGRAWRGRQEVNVVFSHGNALRPDSPVRYNGMDVGRVKTVKITHIDDALLEKLPILTRDDLVNLPLTDSERETLRDAPPPEVDVSVRKIIVGRTMILLTLDLVSEKDADRFRVDDEYHISGSLMGDSSIEIRTGAGNGVPENYNKYFLGVSGDMYSDLGKSIGQVKDILGSMAEMVGGDGQGVNIQMQLSNFDAFTERIDNVSKSMEAKLPTVWDGIDQKISDGEKKFEEIEAKVAGMKPSLDQSMENTQRAIAELRKTSLQNVQDMHERVTQYATDAKQSLASLAKAVASMKETVPGEIAAARDWSERFAPTVEKIDGFFTRADDQLNKGIESTRATLQYYIAMAANLEEKTFQLAKWPWSFARTPTAAEAQLRQEIWRGELARRQYRELRAELERMQQSLQDVNTSDKARAARVDQLLRELDGDLGVTRRGGESSPEPAAPKRRR